MNPTATELSFRELALAVVQSLPEDCTYEQVINELRLAHKTMRGIADDNAGRVVSSGQVKRELRKWLSK